jgi:hypothetical protein
MPIINSEVRSSQYKIDFGMHTSVTASDTVVTRLRVVMAAWANLQSAPVAAAASASASVGNQAGVPAAGAILVQTWASPPAVATAFAKQVSWIAIGY